MTEKAVTTDNLAEFTAALNSHDLVKVTSMMTEDCIYEQAAGPEVYGIRFTGRDAIAQALSEIYETFPDAFWGNDTHRVFGNFGVSEWVFTGTRKDGARLEANGVDLFTFSDGKIASKRAFRKDRPLKNN